MIVAGRVASAGAVVLQIAKAARPARPLSAASDEVVGSLPRVSVVIPARDEADRIAPLLAAVVGAPGIGEVLVVDDESTDGTGAIASDLGATVVRGLPLPDGWAGKAWALQQGIHAASGEWVVCLDADTRPSPELPAAAVARAIEDGLDVLTVAGRFECPTAGSRWLHPAMLTTLVYRYGPPRGGSRRGAARLLANGQCMALRRAEVLDGRIIEAVAGHVVEDVALVREVAARGGRVQMLDGGGLLTTRMFDDLRQTWRGWARSLALPGVERPSRQFVDVATLVCTLALPLPRLLARRADAVDAVLLAARVGTLVGTARAYERRGLPYWCSPLADVPATIAVAVGAIRRGHHWRGRAYPLAPRGRSAAR